jgi:hypothetical protein
MSEIKIEIPEEKPPEEITEVKEDVAKLEGKVETLAEVVSEPHPIPEHEHAFHTEILNRLDRAEGNIDTLIKREVTRTKEESEPELKPEPEPEEQKEYTSKETTATTEELPPETHAEPTIIEPPPARSRKENPSGIWGVLKKAGF